MNKLKKIANFRLLIALVVAAGVVAAVSTFASNEKTYTGTIQPAVKDGIEQGRSTTEYYLTTSPTKTEKLEFDKPPPNDIQVNTPIKVRGTQKNNQTVRVRWSDFLKKFARTPVPPSVNPKRSVAVVTFQEPSKKNSKSDANGQARPAAQLRQEIFTSPKSARNLFLETTYSRIELTGKRNADGDFFGPYSLPKKITSCDTAAWKDLAQKSAKNQGVNLGEYDHVVYVPPKRSQEVCQAGGTADLGGKNSWVFTTVAGMFAHEIGHNLGLHHANSLRCQKQDTSEAFTVNSSCKNKEYADPFDVMGNHRAEHHMNNFSKTNLANPRVIPAEQVQTVTASGTYRLFPQEPSIPGTKVLRIPRQGSQNPGEYLYLEYRMPYQTFDAFGLQDPVVNGLSIRLVRPESTAKTYLYDTVPSTSTLDDAPLQSGREFRDPIAGIKISIDQPNRLLRLAGLQVRVTMNR